MSNLQKEPIGLGWERLLASKKSVFGQDIGHVNPVLALDDQEGWKTVKLEISEPEKELKSISTEKFEVRSVPTKWCLLPSFYCDETNAKYKSAFFKFGHF
jgi:hypothetical protein